MEPLGRKNSIVMLRRVRIRESGRRADHGGPHGEREPSRPLWSVSGSSPQAAAGRARGAAVVGCSPWCRRGGRARAGGDRGWSAGRGTRGDGRLTDLWHVWNTLMLARQLGAPAPDLSISPQAW